MLPNSSIDVIWLFLKFKDNYESLLKFERAFPHSLMLHIHNKDLNDNSKIYKFVSVEIFFII